MTRRSLKLKANDAEDIEIISAILQDAIVPVCDIAYQTEDKSLIMVVQRLCREPHDTAELERVCCALNIRGVEGAQTKGVDFSSQGTRMLDLLALIIEGNCLTFIFAGDAKIRLQLSNWSIFIEDFGESWPTACNPYHEGIATN